MRESKIYIEKSSEFRVRSSEFKDNNIFTPCFSLAITEENVECRMMNLEYRSREENVEYGFLEPTNCFVPRNDDNYSLSREPGKVRCEEKNNAETSLERHPVRRLMDSGTSATVKESGFRLLTLKEGESSVEKSSSIITIIVTTERHPVRQLTNSGSPATNKRFRNKPGMTGKENAEYRMMNLEFRSREENVEYGLWEQTDCFVPRNDDISIRQRTDEYNSIHLN